MLRMLYVHITFYFYLFSVLFLDFFPKQKSFVNPGFLIADIYLLFTFHSVWVFFNSRLVLVLCPFIIFWKLPLGRNYTAHLISFPFLGDHSEELPVVRCLKTTVLDICPVDQVFFKWQIKWNIFLHTQSRNGTA